MKLLDNYFFSISEKSTEVVEVDKNQTLLEYKKYGYETEKEMELDFNILLQIKYPNLKEKGKTELKKVRTKQEKFRDDLIEKYEGKCVISGSPCLEEIEAAHIKPVKDNGEYVADNGLLLKADLHKTFDKYFWSINPDTLILECKKNKLGEFRKYEGKKLYKLDDIKTQMYLRHHYDIFTN